MLEAWAIAMLGPNVAVVVGALSIMVGVALFVLGVAYIAGRHDRRDCL